ncbi:hypothetical protein [Robertkochia flava]|uniref:hypothetical protein n=1 Tax=Robertkochia flava TaxID=3447986 RepID=UPI001CCD2EA8|nr:hypothetical protein [Robertkochia marina]
MSKKRSVLKSIADKKIQRLDITLRILILIMALIVLYDAYRYMTPLYYILFLFLGVFLGKGYRFIYSVKVDQSTNTLKLQRRTIDLLITLLLIAFRFYFGRMTLEFFSIEYIGDALYLLFIGLYWSKWKSVIYHMENKVYETIKNSIKVNNMP